MHEKGSHFYHSHSVKENKPTEALPNTSTIVEVLFGFYFFKGNPEIWNGKKIAEVLWKWKICLASVGDGVFNPSTKNKKKVHRTSLPKLSGLSAVHFLLLYFSNLAFKFVFTCHDAHVERTTLTADTFIAEASWPLGFSLVVKWAQCKAEVMHWNSYCMLVLSAR